jgi:AcrR family transcriptional regulator
LLVALSTPTPRRTSVERRAEVVEAAIAEFAGAGLAGASTERIARRAGVSHGYLFRLVGSRRALFLAAVDHAFGRVQRTFAAAWSARGEGEDAEAVLGCAYAELVADPDELRFLLHAYAACGDPEVRDRVRARWAACESWLRAATGWDDEALAAFMARGLLITVTSAMHHDTTTGRTTPC